MRSFWVTSLKISLKTSFDEAKIVYLCVFRVWVETKKVFSSYIEFSIKPPTYFYFKQIIEIHWPFHSYQLKEKIRKQSMFKALLDSIKFESQSIRPRAMTSRLKSNLNNTETYVIDTKSYLIPSSWFSAKRSRQRTKRFKFKISFTAVIAKKMLIKKS